ncbi:polycystin family receptor for egg jelly-like [Clavelina lepadiformis]|uniref:polycystin family receptor for egg jelly-like n=1 Tax=Clavelina lepadiformis TaxID=159417 RepID=UPI00404209D5
MERFTMNCSLAGIFFEYLRFDFHLMLSSHYVEPGQSVQFVARLTGANSFQKYLDCSIEYDNANTEKLTSHSTIFKTQRSFQYPGNYAIWARCKIPEGTFQTPLKNTYVECGLSMSKLQISIKELNITILNPADLVFSHRYCFPISYSLLLDDVIIAQNQTKQVFDEKKFLLNAFEKVIFKLNSSMQQLVDPGIHNITLLLQNNISSVIYSTPIILIEEIKNFQVTAEEFVGFHPHYFIINATISQGAPISLSIQIKSIESNLSHFNASLFCQRECHSMVVQPTLSQPGMYKVEAIAENYISQSSSWAVIEALPQIYNVYISSPKPIPSYSRNYVYAFVRGDIGDYVMTIYLQGRPENHSFTISKLEYDHKDLPSLPFDARSYKLIKVERVLYHIGMQQVTGFIRNSKQSFPFVGWVDVLETSSCLENLRIRDGNYRGGFENPLKVFDYLTFSVDFKFTCKNMSEVRYKWLVFPVATDMDMATYTYEVEFEKESFEPELIIRADTLSPGLYVIKVKVTSENVTSDVLEGKLKDYTLIEITKKKLHFVILGGNVLQSDNNMTVLRFVSSIDYNKYHRHISYYWFCSIKQEELPTRTVMGKIQRKDSCFDWHTVWVTSDHVMEISMNELRQSEHYYIRLIISGPHYDATLADQEVVVQARPAPIVNLKCWSNCGKYFSPHLSIILQLECDDCLRRKWTLSPNPGHQLPLCDDQEFCKLNASLLNPSSNVTGTGYNIHGENSSVTIFLNALSSHSSGSCIILPRMGSAYTTKFNVTCAGYIAGKYQLMYKFFLQEKGHRYLLQYGFDPVLYDIILPPGRSSNDVTIVIEICTPDQSCVEENLFVTVVANNDVNDDVINELDAALLSNNLQKIAQFVLVLSSTNKLNQSKRKEIISKMVEYPMLSLESVKQIADVISHVTNNPKLLEETQLQDVQDILDRVESFVPFSASRYDDVNFIVKSCMTTTSQLMRLVRFYPFKNDENLRMNRLGKLLMASLTPGEEAISFETKSVDGRLLKLNNHVTNPFDANTSFVQLSNLQSLITDDVINMEIFRYNSTSANFSPFDLKVDSVTSVSITTGWRDELPISKEIAKNLKLEFSLPQQPDKSKIWLRVKSECDGSACRSTAIGSAFIDVEGDSSGAMEATILNIVVGNYEGRVKKLKMFLTLVGQVITMARKEFDKEATHYRWTTKAPFVGFGSYNVTIRADLGPGYYRAGTITSAVFSVWALQCLHWFDAKNGWKDSPCKAHEDTVSGMVVCQCGHYPVTRVVWTQGHKRSTDDFTRAPSLLASKLLVFPNKLDYNEISSNMWQRFLENPIVLSMLFVLYFLYGLGLIWARSKDRQVEAEDLCVEVPDNGPFDKYRYIVTIFTGSRRNSGTSAVVCLRLVGNMATSSAHVIQHHTKILNRGSVKSFLITTSECLGDITAIRLWHDNGGHSPEWFLQRVVVRDLEKNNCWFFLCNRWFKHVIDHVVPAARTKDLHNTRTLFPLRLENHLRDRYLWYAFYGMRPWQRHVMGRIEMLSCCLMITLMIMLTALMFHGNNHAQQGLLLAVGNYTFQWWHVAVGIESALLSSPATFLITTMFRRSQRPHKSLLTDSKSVDDEENNVNDEQNPVSHHLNVADGSKEENLKLELFHEQLPVDNKTHLRVKPNRETSFVEVAETSQHVMSEDRRVHHHQRKEATGKMNQKEKRKLKKESPKTEHHDESKIHHRLKPYGKSRAFEVAGTSQQVLNE